MCRWPPLRGDRQPSPGPAAAAPMRTLQHWMGHADFKTTQIYATTSRSRTGPTRWTAHSPRGDRQLCRQGQAPGPDASGLDHDYAPLDHGSIKDLVVCGYLAAAVANMRCVMARRSAAGRRPARAHHLRGTSLRGSLRHRGAPNRSAASPGRQLAARSGSSCSQTATAT